MIRKPTVKETWQYCLPFGTILLGGETGLDRGVRWAITAKTRAPAFDTLEGSELALLSLDNMRLMDGTANLAQVVRQLSLTGIAALVIHGECNLGARATGGQVADELGLPLFLLPRSEMTLHTLERQIIQLVLDRDVCLKSRSQQIYNMLIQLSNENRGRESIGNCLSSLTGHNVILLDQSGFARLLSHAPSIPPQERLDQTVPETLAIGSSAQNIEAFPFINQWRGKQSWQFSLPFLRDNEDEAPGNDPVIARMPGNDQAALVAPVVLEETVTAWIGFLGENNCLWSEFDRMILSQAAQVFVLEMARDRAVQDAQSRLQGDFLRELIEGTWTDESLLRNRARHLGYNLANSYAVYVFVALVAEPDYIRDAFVPPAVGDGTVDLPPELANLVDKPNSIDITLAVNTLASRTSGAIVYVSERNCVGLLYPYNENDATLPMENSLKEQAESLRRELRESLPSFFNLSCGVGGLAHEPRTLSISFQAARQAAEITAYHLGGERTLAFADLGVYRLLLSLLDRPELELFYEETIARLTDYDRKTHAELVRTLAAFFEYNGNLSRTADSLSLHRNTLMYRIDRIRQITNLDFEDPDTRLSLQVALKIHQILHRKKTF